MTSPTREGLSLRNGRYHYERRVHGKKRSWSLDKYLRARGDHRTIRTRHDADAIVTEIDAAIQAGTIDDPVVAPSSTAAAPTAISFDQLRTQFIATVDPEQVVSWPDEDARLRKIGSWHVPDYGALATLPIDRITAEHLRHAYRTAGTGCSPSYRRKLRRVLKRVFGWSVDAQLLAASPIPKDHVKARKLFPADPETMRFRRLRGDEEANLIAAAAECREGGARLAGLIVAALTTALRIGELLALQWRDILWAERQIVVRAEEQGARKTKKGRRVPLTARLQAELEALAGTNPTGRPWPVTAYVFGNEIGERVRSVRKAWDSVRLRAHNLEPRWTKSGGSLTAASRAQLAAIDLHFHDLRHECALRWHEAQVPLTRIAKLLGHRDLAMLEIYLGISNDDAIEAVLAVEDAAQKGAPAANRRQTGGKLAANGHSPILTFPKKSA